MWNHCIQAKEAYLLGRFHKKEIYLYFSWGLVQAICYPVTCLIRWNQTIACWNAKVWLADACCMQENMQYYNTSLLAFMLQTYIYISFIIVVCSVYQYSHMPYSYLNSPLLFWCFSPHLFYCKYDHYHWNCYGYYAVHYFLHHQLMILDLNHSCSDFCLLKTITLFKITHIHKNHSLSPLILPLFFVFLGKDQDNSRYREIKQYLAIKYQRT